MKYVIHIETGPCELEGVTLAYEGMGATEPGEPEYVSQTKPGGDEIEALIQIFDCLSIVLEGRHPEQTKEMMDRWRVSEPNCIGRGRPDDGCGYSGGTSGDTCPECGGMVLGQESQYQADALARRWDLLDLRKKLTWLTETTETAVLTTEGTAVSGAYRHSARELRKILGPETRRWRCEYCQGTWTAPREPAPTTCPRCFEPFLEEE